MRPVEKINNNIYRISLAWGNAYALTDAQAGKGVALIDCGLQKDRPALLAGLRALGHEPEDVTVVLLTHAHCDHAGNAAYFAGLGAQIVLHEEEACFLKYPRGTYAYSGLRALRRPFTSLTFAIGEYLYPVERLNNVHTVREGEAIDAPGGALQVIHTPGHAPGQIAFYRAQDGVLFSGDAILNIIPNLVPAWRKTALSLPPRLLCDNWKEVRGSARKLVELAPRVLLSGHGLPMTDNTADKLRAWSEAQNTSLLAAFRGKF